MTKTVTRSCTLAMEDRVQNYRCFLQEALKESDEKHLMALLITNDEEQCSVIHATINSEIWIFPRVCELGYLNVLKELLQFGIDINTQYNGKTGLQYACQNGDTHVVKFLLEHGASLKKSQWDENSECYLASLHGHRDIIEILMASESVCGVSLDQSVRYCLFYAACCGGHTSLADKWKSPDMDVNRPIDFVATLNKCENKYPLFAAFEGKHFDVAKSLIMDDHAALTKEICVNFPQFTNQVVRSLCQKLNVAGKQSFDMSNFGVEYVLACCFQPEVAILMESEEETDQTDEESLVETVIDLSYNNIEDLPDDILWKMKGLTVLDIRNNPLGIIYDPVDISSVNSNRLGRLDLSHCGLEQVSGHLFGLPLLEELNLSHNKLTTLNGYAARSVEWKCQNLRNLDVSHNLLTSLPSEMQTCTRMENLMASHNNLVIACNPWECPMKTLDLSDNKITKFAPSADQFWSRTLKRLKLQRNQLDELAQSIVNMRQLSYLDVSENKILHLPSPDNWYCELIYLNLSHNLLGIGRHSFPFRRAPSLNRATLSVVDIPGSRMKSTMMELYLANNDLRNVPLGISDMSKLSVLDLSGNSKITSLPHELGMLRKLLVLKLNDITVADKDLQALITAMDDDSSNTVANDVILYLERKRRNCVHPYLLKMVVLGCKNKSGFCLVKKLVNLKQKNSETQITDHEVMNVTQWDIVESGWKFPGVASKKSLHIEIWELPDTKVMSVIQQCFLTLNSLYLLVHDVSSHEDDLQDISKKVASIMACVLRPRIIVVCTYMDKEELEKLGKVIRDKAEKAFPKIKFLAIVCNGSDNLDSLRQEILVAYSNMRDASYEKESKLQDRQVPSVFLEIVKNVKRMQHKICTMQQFLESAECKKCDLEDGIDKNLKLHEFLLQVGAMLHYNVQMGELADYVFLDPSWLFHVISKFLKSLTTGRYKEAELPIAKVKEKFQELLPSSECDYIPAFLTLLEAFDIGVRIMDGNGVESLLVPSLLPKQPPHSLNDDYKGGLQAARLYFMPAVPSAFWNHVISQLIVAFERFSSLKWKLGEKKSYSGGALDRTKSFRMNCTSSLKGLRIFNKKVQFWRTGVMIYHNQGLVVVEEVECTCVSEAPPTTSGILITVHTTGSTHSDEESTLKANLTKLATIGIARDELEEVMELYNPKFKDPSELQTKPFALCPLCYNIKPGSGTIDVTDIHFTFRDCAQMVMWKDNVVCDKGPTSLSQLVPELYFFELPEELILNDKDIKLSDVKLGHGIAGTVTKGTYKNIDVAIKVFHTPTVRPISLGTSLYPNVADLGNDRKLSLMELDQCDTEQAKISNAFSDVRREVGIISKLSHRCIVKFIGVCVRPHLLLVLELAPHGSLRAKLLEKVPQQKLKRDPDTVISNMIFDKDLTYKIILQIGSGLSYLHKNNIIYRDLKPDNILVMSWNVDDSINIKLSDYGISKFATLQGLTGLFGTVGYMAPEVMAKQAYTEKVDLYSYGIVMLEVLTGIAPLGQNQRPLLSQMSTVGEMPSHIQGCSIHCSFPYLELLMSECWSCCRPSAQDVVKRMKQDHFLLLHDCIWLVKNIANLEVTCIYVCENAGKWNIWISESISGNSEICRLFSVYDIGSGCFTVHRKKCPGARVISMVKSGSEILLACQGQKTVETIVRGYLNTFDVAQRITLDDPPTKLISHTLDLGGVNENVIFMGDENGCVTSYMFKHFTTKAVKLSRTQLAEGVCIGNVCSVTSSLIAVACEMKVYFLQISQEAQHLRTGQDLVTVCGSVSLHHVNNMYQPVASMICETSAVWCALEDSSNLVRIDTKLQAITHILTLSWDSLQDKVSVEEKEPVLQPQGTSQGGVSLPENKSNVCNSSQENDRSICDLQVNMTHTFPVATSKKSTSLPWTSYNQKHDFPKAASYDEDDLSVYCEINPDDCFVSEHSDGDCSDKDKPPVPPRKSKSTLSLNSTPVHQSGPPPPIPRRFSSERQINVTSLEHFSDVLFAGTNCGGSIVIPLTRILNKTSDTRSLHLKLPVLRHLAKRKANVSRSRSDSSISNDNVSFKLEPQDCTGLVSVLTRADKKLVSFHSIQEPVLRVGKVRFESHPSRREGSVFSSESEMSKTMNTERGSFGSRSITNSTEEDIGGIPNSPRQKSLLQLPTSSYGSDLTEIADIAIWDEITWQRLEKIREYGEDLI